MKPEEKRHLDGKKRRHHTKTGARMIKSGSLERSLKKLAKQLGIKYGNKVQ